MKKYFLLLILGMTTLTACGVKGPLYFPENTEQTQQP